jgi:Protein of unknown function (DUF2637).
MGKLIRPLALFIMIAAMASSYHTQLGLFRRWDVDLFTAVIAPFAVDALAIICSIALGIRGAKGKGLAATVLVMTLGASMTANFIAGATLGSKIVHAGMAFAYLLAELVASKVQVPDGKAAVVAEAPVVETPATQEAVTEPVADEAASKDLPVAPVSPGPTSEGARQRPYSERHERRLRTGR